MILYSKSRQGFFDTAIHSVLPSDAVEISQSSYDALMHSQSTGKMIDWSGDAPVAIDPPAPSHAAIAFRQIIALESQITPRRIREALLSGDHSFIESIEAQIAALRSQLA